MESDDYKDPTLLPEDIQKAFEKLRAVNSGNFDLLYNLGKIEDHVRYLHAVLRKDEGIPQHVNGWVEESHNPNEEGNPRIYFFFEGKEEPLEKYILDNFNDRLDRSALRVDLLQPDEIEAMEAALPVVDPTGQWILDLLPFDVDFYRLNNTGKATIPNRIKALLNIKGGLAPLRSFLKETAGKPLKEMEDDELKDLINIFLLKGSRRLVGQGDKVRRRNYGEGTQKFLEPALVKWFRYTEMNR